MIALICLLLVLLATPFRSKLALEAENAALRQQIIVLRHKLRGRFRLSNGDRLFFVWLSALALGFQLERAPYAYTRTFSREELFVSPISG
jgi:hypothetical protein